MQNEASVPSPLEGLPVWVNDANQVWPTLRIARSIPLSRLEWLWNSHGASIRDSSTSARAVFEVSASKSLVIPVPSKFPHDWYRNPYVYTLITTLHELESIKEPAWARIRRFVEQCKDKFHEYLIILAATDDELSHKKRIVEKLRAEVNLTSRGRERLVMVPPAAIREEQRPITHLHHSPSHQDLLVRLRECVREGAESRVQAYEEEVSRSYLNRASASWTLAQFFALKEGMAFVFVQLGRRDLAVRFYDELQVTMTERDEWMGKFCEEAAADAATGVSDPEAKDYRVRLVANSITEIGLRTYLFSRQLTLLLTDRKFSDVAERGLKFITALARRCAEETLNGDGTISAVFRDTWVFTTARALAAALTPAIPSPLTADNALSAQLGTPRERHTARLIAGFHVHALKAFLGLACVALPGCLAPDDPLDKRDKAKIAEEARSTSNERLRNALSDPRKAEVLHSEIANAAASLYEMGGRARGAAALDGDAGVVRLRNGSYGEAESLLSAQCSRFINDNGWDDLHKRQRLELAHAEKELDRVQEYLVSCLTMLYMSRSERQLWNRPLHSTEDEETYSEDAAHWVAETTNVASRLPRVMKYKAERLFQISLLPNASMWVEGDHGSATVRIRSDLPTKMKLDSILMECRCTNSMLDAMQKSALHSRDESGTLTQQGDSSFTSDSNSLSVASTPGEHSDIVVLRSKESIDIVSGINDILVHVDNIPRFGRYMVTLVALFLGNLKLVQAETKGSPIPIVTTKGGATGRSSSLSASSSALSDYFTGEGKFPMFYAIERDPSAFLAIDGLDRLYLAPRSTQSVRVRITAGKHGLKEGSLLTCSLLSLHRVRPAASAAFVRFSDMNTPSKNLGNCKPVILNIRRVAKDSGRDFDHGEAVVRQPIHGGEVLETDIALQLAPNCSHFQDQSLDSDSESRSCVLQLQLSCFERDSGTSRKFLCQIEEKLTFVSPIVTSARIELNCEWGGGDVSRALGLDGTPLGDGGTLLCAVQSATQPERSISILRATLELPAWLELRPDEPPAHTELLPCALRNGCAFILAFDIQNREESSNQQQYAVDESQRSDMVFDKAAVERRLSRAMASSSEMAESLDDISQWGLGRRRQTQLRLQAEGVQDGTGVSEVNIGMKRLNIGADGAGDGVECVNETDEDSKIMSHNEQAIVCTEDSEDIRLDNRIDQNCAVAEGPSNLKEAEEVVDLSVPQGSPVQTSAQLLPSTGSNSLATLKINIRVEGIESVTCIERKVCMDVMRRAEKRYRIERSIKKVGECGREMELQFAVQMMAAGRSGPSAGTSEYDDVQCTDGAEVLQYEIDADPTVWIVVGRRRGRLNVIAGLSTMRSAQMIPLASGRQRVPCVRLFTNDGRGLASSRYENVNEYMQVAVIPYCTVVSACSVMCDGENDPGRASGKRGAVQSKSNMPVVIASDSFFGS